MPRDEQLHEGGANATVVKQGPQSLLGKETQKAFTLHDCPSNGISVALLPLEQCLPTKPLPLLMASKQCQHTKVPRHRTMT